MTDKKDTVEEFIVFMDERGYVLRAKPPVPRPTTWHDVAMMPAFLGAMAIFLLIMVEFLRWI